MNSSRPRIKPSTREKLLQAISLLNEVGDELADSRPFVVGVVCSVADGLSHLQSNRWQEFSMVLQNGEVIRLGATSPIGQALTLVESAVFTVRPPIGDR